MLLRHPRLNITNQGPIGRAIMFANQEMLDFLAQSDKFMRVYGQTRSLEAKQKQVNTRIPTEILNQLKYLRETDPEFR